MCYCLWKRGAEDNLYMIYRDYLWENTQEIGKIDYLQRRKLGGYRTDVRGKLFSVPFDYLEF